MGNFASCSYNELTNCLQHRVKWLREYRAFQDDASVSIGRELTATLRMNACIMRFEIRLLLKLRRKKGRLPRV